MKIYFAFIPMILIASTIYLSFVGPNRDISKNVKIVAHRGAMMERPENTMAAFKKANELRSDIIELDLFTSSDGHLFVLHDATLDRTTNGKGIASELTLSELQKFDAGSHFDIQYSSERIPRFKDVLVWAVKEDAVLLLDLKERGFDFAERVANEVKSAKAEHHVVVGVRTPQQSAEFGALLPNSKRLAFIRSPEYISEFADTGVYIIRLWLRWLKADPTVVEKVHLAGTKIMINGKYGNLEETRIILKFNPDWILVDDVVQLKHSLEKLNI